MSYPGPWPDAACRLLGERLVPLDGGDVAAALGEGRHAVLAVGSNGSPAQLHRKLTAGGVVVDVPLLRVSVAGLVAAHTAWAAQYGSIPTSASAADGARSDLVLTLLTDEQAAAIDRTEGGYERRTLDPDRHPVVDAVTGATVRDVTCYVAGTELLADPANGAPVVLRPQGEVWTWLLDAIPGARRLLGDTPEAAVAALAADRQRRSALVVLLVRAGATTPVRPVAI